MSDEETPPPTEKIVAIAVGVSLVASALRSLDLELLRLMVKKGDEIENSPGGFAQHSGEHEKFERNMHHLAKMTLCFAEELISNFGRADDKNQLVKVEITQLGAAPQAVATTVKSKIPDQ